MILLLLRDLSLLLLAAEAWVLVDAILGRQDLIEVKIEGKPERNLDEHADPSNGFADL